MSNCNFRRALLDVDHELASVPLPGNRDVRSIVSARRRTPSRPLVLLVAATLAILLLARARERGPALVAGFEIAAPPSSWQIHSNELAVLSPALELEVPGFGHIVAARGARVATIDGGIHVVGGQVEVDVRHRPRGAAPALVRVSHGTIAVLGTRFTIEQLEHGGRVMLHEGRIRFDAGEHSVELVPGSSLTWPLARIASTPPPTVAPPAARGAPLPEPGTRTVEGEARARETPPKREPQREDVEPAIETTTREQPKPPPLDVDRVLVEVANLRARRRFAEAAALLERTITGASPTRTIERFSYELGEIQTYQLTSTERACRHWRLHRQSFPQGRYTDEIDAAVRRLGCEGQTP